MSQACMQSRMHTDGRLVVIHVPCDRNPHALPLLQHTFSTRTRGSPAGPLLWACLHVFARHNPIHAAMFCHSCWWASVGTGELGSLAPLLQLKATADAMEGGL